MRNLFKLILIILPVISSFSIAQLPWSTPEPLTDTTTANNLQPTFAKDINEFFDVYNMLVWQRGFGDRSQIFFKSLENPETEIPLSPNSAGVYSANPSAAYNNDYTNPDYTLIVWQSNQNGNEDLFSAVYSNGKVGSIIQVTTDTLNDIHPDVRKNLLVWERDGNILFSEYSTTDSNWTQEIVLDSMNARDPVVDNYFYLEPRVVYEKDLKIYLKKQTASGWQGSHLIGPAGENRLPQMVPGWWSFIFWQHRKSGLDDWDIMSYDLQMSTRDSLDFSNANETSVQAAEFTWITKRDLDGPSLIAFESDMDGYSEIYAKVPPYGPIVNVSQFMGIDSLPAVSDFSAAEAQVRQFRVWCAWQKFLNGKWQIWGSYTELDWGLSVPDPEGIPSFRLFQNYPNPFNPSTTITYQLAVAGDVELTIYNLLGQQVRRLVNGKQTAGVHHAVWNGRDDAGKETASGVYIYRLKAGGNVFSKKMLLLR